jgi:hypothetical protein
MQTRACKSQADKSQADKILRGRHEAVTSPGGPKPDRSRQGANKRQTRVTRGSQVADKRKRQVDKI